jgi:hypothetical protein
LGLLVEGMTSLVALFSHLFVRGQEAIYRS